MKYKYKQQNITAAKQTDFLHQLPVLRKIREIDVPLSRGWAAIGVGQSTSIGQLLGR
jgi:hypothetical protein